MLAALLEAADWDPSIKISVNISPAQSTDSWLAQRIVRLLTETGFPAERLVVEITESSLFADIDLARSIVTSLKNQGIRLALDDFGTGFSSLSHLRSLPFDVIKIDRSFVSTIHAIAKSAAIVRAVTTLADALDVPVTGRGHRGRGRPTRRCRLRLRGRPGLVFRQADGGRPGGEQLLRRRRQGLASTPPAAPPAKAQVPFQTCRVPRGTARIARKSGDVEAW